MNSGKTRRAVIDIGTNSVKLLLGDVLDGQVLPVYETSEQTRLGAGFFETRMLQPKSVEHTAKVVAVFAEKSREFGAVKIRIIATSAARDALNPETLLNAVQRESGLTLRIISGDQEALWAFQGVASDPRFAKVPLLLMDVGGGSTEFILGDAGRILFQRSCQMGAVRGLEKLRPADPPAAGELTKARGWVEEILNREIRAELEAQIKALRTRQGTNGIMLIGTGGTSTLLAKMQEAYTGYERNIIEAAIITAPSLEQRLESLWSMTLEARRGVIGLPPNRADVILTGSAIFQTVMQVFDFAELRVSTRGLRYAALLAE